MFFSSVQKEDCLGVVLQDKKNQNLKEFCSVAGTAQQFLDWDC